MDYVAGDMYDDFRRRKGNDILKGGAGNDILRGGTLNCLARKDLTPTHLFQAEVDVLTGGRGVDKFILGILLTMTAKDHCWYK